MSNKNFRWTDLGVNIPIYPRRHAPGNRQRQTNKIRVKHNLLGGGKKLVKQIDTQYTCSPKKSQLPDISDARYWARSFSLVGPDLTVFFAGRR